MMLNAPRHSDHHINPARPFPVLTLIPGQMPMLPHSLPVMAVLALVPPLWRRLMDKRALRWRERGLA
jgi:alkane 1-monooxygenase